jgi:hypothetical protein
MVTIACLMLFKEIIADAQNLLGYTAVFLIECRLTFQRCVLPPSSGLIIIALMMKVARAYETSVDIQLRTRQYIPGDSGLQTRRRENLKSHEIIAVYTENHTEQSTREFRNHFLLTTHPSLTKASEGTPQNLALWKGGEK